MQNCNDIITRMLNECYMIVTNWGKKSLAFRQPNTVYNVT